MTTRRNVGHLGRPAQVFIAAVAVIWVAGCTRRTTIEIDTTKATGFKWNGRVRVTDQPLERNNLFAPRDYRREVTRVELLSDNDRNVVIHPQADLRFNEPYASVQDVGQPPDQFLVPLRNDVAEYEHAWKTMLALDELKPKEREDARKKAWDAAVAKYEQVAERLQKREFGDVTGAEAAFGCAFEGKQIETIYRLDDSTVVRVRIEDRSLLTVTVEDRDGQVLYRYEPQPLTATPVKNGR